MFIAMYTTVSASGKVFSDLTLDYFTVLLLLRALMYWSSRTAP